MGLDGVELIMAYEEAFGVQFTNADAIRIRTPRDVIELIASRVPLTTESICLEQRAFYRIRAALVELSPIERRQIRTFTPLAHVFPLMSAEQIRRRLAERLAVIDVDQFATVGDLATWVTAHALHLVKRNGPWSRSEIEATVKQVTLAQLGDVPYAEDSLFVEDLGVD
jgi:hypothetical protein